MSSEYKKLQNISIRTPPEIAKKDNIRVPIVKGNAYIEFALKESDCSVDQDLTAPMTTDATHELLHFEEPEKYLYQAILSYENAMDSLQETDYPNYTQKVESILIQLKEIYETVS